MKNHILQFVIAFVLFSCNSSSDVKKEKKISGKELADMYCQSCHQLPHPQLLDKKSWEKHVLPRMGSLMGIYDGVTREGLLQKNKTRKLIEEANVFPTTPLMDSAKWNAIKDYFISNAPAKLPAVKPKEIAVGLNQFKVQVPEFKLSPPSTTLIKFSEDNHIYVGDVHSQTLLEFDENQQLLKRGNVSEGAVWLEEIDNALWLTVMGSFSPSDESKGLLLTIPKEGGKLAAVPQENLRRPVHTAYGDVNNDGLMDAVVSEYGVFLGRLSLLINKGNNEFKQKVILNQSGALRSYLRDFNNDGLLDVIALFGQGNEGIYILYNKGNNVFEPKQVLQFSPSNGSSFFSLYDFNQDGFEDIVYTAGDNADFSPVMKPYHGVYIYENDGKNNFSQSFFYQLNGAYAAIPRDYDLDGDIDIAAISFFPDYENSPEESFVYLENKGDMNYKASTFKDATMGRWIVMDAKDMDNDGDEDLILGSLAFEVVPKNDIVGQWVENGIPYIILENTTR